MRKRNTFSVKNNSNQRSSRRPENRHLYLTKVWHRVNYHQLNYHQLVACPDTPTPPELHPDRLQRRCQWRNVSMIMTLQCHVSVYRRRHCITYARRHLFVVAARQVIWHKCARGVNQVPAKEKQLHLLRNCMNILRGIPLVISQEVCMEAIVGEGSFQLRHRLHHYPDLDNSHLYMVSDGFNSFPLCSFLNFIEHQFQLLQTLLRR